MKTQMQFYDGLDVPDEKKEAKNSDLIPGLETLLIKLDQLISKGYHWENKILSEIDEILTPEHINRLLPKIRGIHEEITSKYKTGSFFSKLIQNSYDAGYNNFIINTLLEGINGLGNETKGTKDNPIKIKIFGNTGDSCGISAEYCNFEIHGNVDQWFGTHARNSDFKIYGNVKCWCASHARDSNFYIQGDVEDNFGMDAKSCNLEVKGKIGPWDELRAKDSTLTTYDQETYNKIVRKLRAALNIHNHKGNTAILKDQQGNIESISKT